MKKFLTNMKSYDYDIRRWTRGAIDCYMRGCICTGHTLYGVDGQLSKTFTPCPIYELIFRHYPRGCQMKYAVIATVRKFGILGSMERKTEEITKE